MTAPRPSRLVLIVAALVVSTLMAGSATAQTTGTHVGDSMTAALTGLNGTRVGAAAAIGIAAQRATTVVLAAREGADSGKVQRSRTGRIALGPTIAAARRAPAANAARRITTAAMETVSCSDVHSGVAGCPSPQEVTREGAGSIEAARATTFVVGKGGGR